MIRLFGLLFIGIFATLMIAGEDHGQKRYGLMLADKQAAELAAKAAAPVAEVTEPKAVFIPAQPVMQVTQVSAQVAASQTVTQVAVQPDQTLLAPAIPGGQLFTVASRGANVRQGPGTTFAVLDSLMSGEQVLVVTEAQPVDGWSKVRLEGDGVEGYIATRLLTKTD